MMLTEKQQAVLDMILDGATNKEIASRLDIGLRTAELRRERLMKHFGAKSPAHLGRLATEQKLRGESEA